MISRCSSPIPAKIVWPVSGSVVDAQGRIFLDQLLNGDAQLLLIGLRLGLDRKLNHGRREIDRLEQDRVLFVADRVAGDNLSSIHRRADVTRQNLLDLFTLVGVHLHQAANPFFTSLADVIDEIAGIQLAE